MSRGCTARSPSSRSGGLAPEAWSAPRAAPPCGIYARPAPLETRKSNPPGTADPRHHPLAPSGEILRPAESNRPRLEFIRALIRRTAGPTQPGERSCRGPVVGVLVEEVLERTLRVFRRAGVHQQIRLRSIGHNRLRRGLDRARDERQRFLDATLRSFEPR